MRRWDRVNPSILWIRLSLVVGSTLVYVLVFFLLYPRQGLGVGAFSVLPVMAAGWWFGLRAGLSAGLLALPVNMFLLNIVGRIGWGELIERGAPGFVAVILAGLVVGRLHDVGEQIKRELGERQQAEDALRESEKRYQVISELMSDMTYSYAVHPDGTISREWLAGNYSDLTGFRPEEIQDYQGYHPEDKERAALDVQAVLAGQTVKTEYRLLTKGGDLRWVEAIRRPEIVDGRVVRFYGAARDITERKRTEEALRTSEERYRYVVMATRDAIYDWDSRTHTDLRNETYQMLYAPNEPIGSDDWWEQHIHPDDRPRVMEGIQKAFREGDPFWSDEYRFRRFDGRYAAIIDRGYILYDDTGQPIRMIGAMTDISERKQAEEALRASEERFRYVAMATRDAIYDWDMRANTVFRNDAYQALYAPDAAIGSEQTWWEQHLHPDDYGRVMESLNHAFAQKSHFWSEEYRLRRLDHSYLTIIDSGYILYDDTGQPLRMIGAMTDISERKQAEIQRLELALAQERTQLLAEFLNTISHDLKTPLSVINTSLYLLERATDPEYRRHKLEDIKTQAHLLDKLIQDILTVSRLNTVPELVFQNLDLNQVVAKIQKQLQTVAEKRYLTLGLDLDHTLPPVLASEVELERALVNLVENALHYTLPNGSVHIRTFGQADQAVVEVRDTGIGIDKADLPHIFDPFYRTDRAKVTDVGGTGLGLAIVKKTVEIHRGSIEVESTPGQGSTFRVHLPIQPTNAQR